MCPLRRMVHHQHPSPATVPPMLTSRSSFLALLFAASLAFAATAAPTSQPTPLGGIRTTTPPRRHRPGHLGQAHTASTRTIATIADLTADFEQTKTTPAVHKPLVSTGTVPP